MARVLRGFTLIELMLVVTLLGIMAAIAIPSFLRFTWRARSAELPANLQALKGAAQTFYSDNEFYMVAGPSPTVCTNGSILPGSSKCTWAPWDADGSDLDRFGFSGLGWIPEGPVYAQYAMVVGCPAASGAGPQCFTAEARSDIDGNGTFSIWEYAKQEKPPGLGFAGGVNFGGNVPPIDESGNNVIDQVQKDFTSDGY